MKIKKIVYWVATSLISLLYLASTTFYITDGDTVRGMIVALGYPAYLVPLLIVLKPLGVVAILSRRSLFLSDLAYAGMFFHLLLANSAHMAAGDYGGMIPATVGLVMLVTSFLTQNDARKRKLPYAPSVQPLPA
ncbi:hypothetical protein BCY90_18680 [Agrobacterium deltaense]|uniref:DoxX family protein n=1 Tax=Agrobacterium TaxID=357 RepID=UPI0007459CCB|nr:MULTISPECIES: DoxX family protein [Agrobacterium]KVK53997.1 hypothetical protein L901_19115 [Agrobacterium sp. D14]RKF40661.1 hypothetical protein BCY90_18680 [Agrobacterium deltaense]